MTFHGPLKWGHKTKSGGSDPFFQPKSRGPFFKRQLKVVVNKEVGWKRACRLWDFLLCAG